MRTQVPISGSVATDGSRLACIEVRRSRQKVAIWRRLSIRIDGVEAGAVGFGRTVRLCVVPGSHGVAIALDWARSPEVRVDVAPGATVVLEAGIRQRGWRMLTVWIEALVRPGRVLDLRTVED